MSSPTKRWVVRPGDGGTVEDIVRKIGDTPAAIVEGRVFVGKKRVSRADVQVSPGDEVRVGARDERHARTAEPARTGELTGRADIEARFVDEGLIACIKPAGIPTVPDHAGASHALVALAARAVGLAPGVLRVTSRLDRGVSGVVLFASTDEAEARLRRARAEGTYARRYVAIASHASTLIASPKPWSWPIGRAREPRLRAVSGIDAKVATTRWTIASATSPTQTDMALVVAFPQTGRTHQIRLHASTAGGPLFGDRDYGGPSRITLPGGLVVGLSRIALHAARVSVPGKDGRPIVVEAQIPAQLRQTWADLGGAPEAWDRALTCEEA